MERISSTCNIVDVANSLRADAAPMASETWTRRPLRPRRTLPAQHPPLRREPRQRPLLNP